MIPQKKIGNECRAIHVDHISNLPDDVINNILSRLPTSDAVGTSILSKNWEHKWTSVYNIDIDDKEQRHITLDTRAAIFIRFMERTLLHTRNARSIHFKLSDDYELSRMASWIHTLLSHNNNVEILHMDISSVDFVLSSSLLGNSLKKLDLRVQALKVPTLNCFSNLTSLYLEYVEIHNENSIANSTLVFSFPVLEEITLNDCNWSGNLVEIHAPALDWYKSFTAWDTVVEDYTINIIGARLEMFCSSDHSLENFILTGTTTVFASLINVPRDDDDQETVQKHGVRVRILLNGFSSTLEHLEISVFLAGAILESKQGFLPLPTFAKLGRLDLCADSQDPRGDIEALFDLLHVTPSLKILVIINIDIWYGYGYDYDAVERIPSCIKSNLEEVEFKGEFLEIPDALSKILLKTAAKLKRFHYEISDDQSEDDIIEKLLAFPRASSDLTVTACIS